MPHTSTWIREIAAETAGYLSAFEIRIGKRRSSGRAISTRRRVLIRLTIKSCGYLLGIKSGNRI